MISVKENELNIILNIIKSHVPTVTGLAFGSRISNHHKPYSDLDIAIKTHDYKSLNFRQLGDIKEAFMTSDLNYRVDVIDYYNTTQQFRKIIDDKNVQIYP